MKRYVVKRHLSTLAAAVAVTIVAGTAWAYWSAGSVPGGNGAAAATSVNQGATPTGNAVGTTVTVSWTATTLASGAAVGGYLVKRYDSSTLVLQTILSACTGTVTALSCVESSVPTGSWKYTVTPKIGTNWLGQESSFSGTVTTSPPDTTAPTNTITLSGVTGGAYKSGTNVYYRGSAIGSFTLTNAVTDAGSGPASSQTATLGNTPTNWTHTGSTVSTPAGGPYVSNTFSWTAGATSSPTEAVTGRDAAGNTAVTNLSYVNDSTNPTNGTINYAGGYQPGRSVSITFTSGTDTGGSGVSPTLGRIKRYSATMTGGVCGTYTAITHYAVNPTSPYVDTGVSVGMCYMYEYVTVDNVGNTSFATSAAEAKIDYAGAVNNTTGALSHWRLGEASTTLSSTDSMTGTAASALTSHTGEVGATWTNLPQSGSVNTEKISSGNRAFRLGTGMSINYASATPPSADYSVEADLYYRGALTNDSGGVITRLTSGTQTYYMGHWYQSAWRIGEVTSGVQAARTASAAQPALVVGQTYRLRLAVSGTNPTVITLYVNGVQMTTYSDSSPITAAGKGGIIDGYDTFPESLASKSDTVGLHFDNFQITQSTYPRAADSKGNNTGDYENGPTLGVAGALTGDANTAATFDGVNDQVQVFPATALPAGAGVRSMEAWFKTSSAARQVIFQYGSLAATQEFGLWIDAGGATMTVWGYGNGNDKVFTMPAAVNNGAWHQVVLTYNGTTLTLYIDGVALATQAATKGTVMDAYGFGIGAIINPGDANSGGFFNGSIDEVSFYTSTLTQTDVTNHYLLGTLVVPEPVVTTTVADLAYFENGTTAVDSGLTVTDADSANLTAATVTMTTNYLNGQDTLAFTNQAGITGTWTAGTGVMALSGTATVAQYQTALRSITYNNNSDYPNTSARLVTFAVSDGTNTSNAASRNITVTAVNDAPAGSPATLTVNEDATYSFVTADFGMYDTADNGANSLLAVKMTTLPALGTLKLSGVNVTVGQVVSAANITSGLLTYAPVANANGTGYTSFTFQAQDDGGIANGGIDLDASPNTITFNVTAVNDAPVNSVPITQNTPPNTPKVFSTGTGNLVSTSDVDATTVQVQLVSTNGTTTLFGTMPGSLTFTVGDGTADATMTFSGTIAAVNTALNGLSFNPTAAFSGTASLQIVTSDLGATGTGGTLTDSDTITIDVSGRPVVTTTVADLAFTENGAAVALDAGITVTDPDSTITGATVSMTTNYVSGQDTLNFSTQNGITGNWVAGTGVLTLSGSTTAANYQTALRSITYSNTANNLTSNNHNVNFVAHDAIGASNTATRQVAVSAVNDAPVNSVPGAQTTAVNTAEVFTGGSLISISDDASSGSMQIQLVSTNGATTLSTLTGLTFSVGDGTADATMTFTGTVAAVNTALAGLSFNPSANWVGTATLQIVTSDQGNTGSGGTLTDTDSVDITVTSSYGIFAATSGVAATGGSANYSAPTYTVVGEGTSIGTTTDDFQYLYTTLTGDGTLTAQVASITNPCPTTGIAGVMMRDSLATNSMFAMADQRESGDNSADQWSRLTNGATAVNASTASTVPEWVRVTRTGNSFTTFRSTDGNTWVALGTAKTIVMGSTIFVGLAASSDTNSCFNTSTFNNVSLTTPSVPPVLTASGGTTAHTENVPVVVDGGITVTDVDDTNMESGTVTVGSGYTAGQDVLAFTNQNGISGSYSAPTLTLTGSATKANWQTALQSITYNNTSNTPNTGNRTINFVVNDGSGDSNTGAKTVSVSAVNDAPANSVPGAQTTSMNTAKVFSGGSLISITDVDAAGGTMQVQLVSTNGATTLSTLTGLTFTVGDGTADATMTFTGSFAAVNTALSGLSFNPTAAFTGAASLQIVTADQGNTGSGGTLTDSDTVAITVTSGPSCATEMVTNGGFEGGTGWSQTPAGTVTTGGAVLANTGTWKAALGGQGANQTETVSQSVTIPAGCTATLSYWLRITTAETTHPFDFFTVRVNGTALVVPGYSDSDAGPSYVLRTLDLSAYAGQTVTLLFESDEDGSIISTFWLDDVSLTGAPAVAPVVTASGGTTAHTENVALAVDTGITVTDADSTNIASGTVTVGSGYTAGQDVLAFTNQNGITGSWSAPTMTLTGSATKANWQTALRSITYNNTSNTPDTSNRTINFVVNDGGTNSNTGAKTVSVAAVNDGPANTVPGAQTTAVDTAKVFSTGNGNLISITDLDAASADLRVQLVSTNGATTLSTLTGLSFTVGDGTADATMTFDGTVAEVNAALAGMSFNPTASFSGAASLQIVTNDQGNTGSGGSLSDNDTVAITVGTSTSYFDAIWAEGSLLNYYRMDDTTGTAIDDIETANNNGTYFGSPTKSQAGAIAGNSSVLFDGVDDYGSITRQISTSFTIEFWFKSSNGVGATENMEWPNYAPLVDGNISGTSADLGISLSQGGVVYAGIGGGTSPFPPPQDVTIRTVAGGYDDGNWHYVAMTRTGATFKLYIDNAAVVNGTADNTGAVTSPSLTFGRTAAGTTRWYTGNLDEIAFYNAVLAPASIAAHYAAR